MPEPSFRAFQFTPISPGQKPKLKPHDTCPLPNGACAPDAFGHTSTPVHRRVLLLGLYDPAGRICKSWSLKNAFYGTQIRYK